MSAKRRVIRVGTPDVRVIANVARWSIPVEGPEGMPPAIWYEVPADFSEMLTDRADPALIALTIPAMRLGTPIIIDGPVTDDLAFSYPDLQALYSASGDRPPVTADFRNTLPAASTSPAVAAGFSAGVDSYALLAEHHYATSVPAGVRLTHLLYNNVGSHAEYGEDLWRRRHERVVPVAEQLGLPLIGVNSNLASIPAPGLRYQQLSSPANASVAHLLAAHLRTWIFASSVDFRQVKVALNARSSAIVDPIALPLMSTTSLTLRAASSRLRRVDKVMQVAEIRDAWTSLDVCFVTGADSVTNCSRCSKCRITLAALDLIGAVDRFESQFDLDAWRRDREMFLARATLIKEPAFAELNELMEETGYRPTRSDMVRAAAESAKGRLPRSVRHLGGRARRTLRRAFGGNPPQR